MNAFGKIVFKLDGMNTERKDNNKTVADIMKSNEKLVSELNVAKNTSNLLKNKVDKLESQIYLADQYPQRNNIEVSGIPDNIEDSNLF